MAIDVGSKSVGIALTDPMKMTARPLTTLTRAGLKEDAESICGLLDEHRVERLIVGEPRFLSGQESPVMSVIRPLVEEIRRRRSVEIHWQDERLSSKEAEKKMAELKVPPEQRRKKRDEFAAALILQWHLEEQSEKLS
jgi:putative holliday junction resolvase